MTVTIYHMYIVGFCVNIMETPQTLFVSMSNNQSLF